MHDEEVLNCLTSEEISDLLYCIKQRRDSLFKSVEFFNSIIKDNGGRRLELLDNCVSSYRSELIKLDTLYLKLQNLL